MTRDEVVRRIAERILALENRHPVRVGIDGVSAAGKTTLADELAEALARQPRQVIRAGLDDFHTSPEKRYRLGRYSPEGYYRDAINLEAVREQLLLPLGPGGTRRYRTGRYGRMDAITPAFEKETANDDAIVLIDGIFLFRPELIDCWDYRIFIEVDVGLAMEHGIQRDAAWMGGVEEARRRYETRYVPGERLYLESVSPWELADVVITNNLPEWPEVSFRA